MTVDRIAAGGRVRSTVPTIAVQAVPRDRPVRLATILCQALIALTVVSGMITTQVTYGFVAIGATLLLLRYQRELRSTHFSFGIIVLASLAAVSLAWSSAPGVTLARLPAYLSVCLTCAILGPILGLSRLRSTIGNVLRAATLATAAFGTAFPGWALGSEVSIGMGWDGPAFSKNYLGLLMAIAFACNLAEPDLKHRRWWHLITAYVLLRTSSATALGIVFVVITMHLLHRPQRQRRPGRTRPFGRVLALLLSSFAAIAAVFDVGFVAGVLGRDATFTGRTGIWEYVWQAVKQRPLLGYGFQSTWGDTDFQNELARQVGFNVNSAHSGVLDLALSLGAVGIAVQLLLLIAGLSRTFKAELGRTDRAWARAMIAVVVIDAISESVLTNTYVSYLLLVLAALIQQTKQSGRTMRDGSRPAAMSDHIVTAERTRPTAARTPSAV